jgi:hypothetical protein
MVGEICNTNSRLPAGRLDTARLLTLNLSPAPWKP